jgi:spatacsin
MGVTGDVGLNVLLCGAGVCQQKLLSDLIMYDNSTTADALCGLNGWDRRTLKLHAVELGLRYRQIDVVQPALSNLDLDQQMMGCQVCNCC